MRGWSSAGTIFNRLSILARHWRLDREREPKGTYRGFQGFLLLIISAAWAVSIEFPSLGLSHPNANPSHHLDLTGFRSSTALVELDLKTHATKSGNLSIYGPFRAGPRRKQSVSQTSPDRREVSIICAEPSHDRPGPSTTSGFGQPLNVITDFVGVLFEEAT